MRALNSAVLKTAEIVYDLDMDVERFVETQIDQIVSDGVSYELHCYTSLSQVESLSGAWRDLEKRSAEKFSLFQSSDWCLNWLRSFSKGLSDEEELDIKIYTLENQGKVDLLMPLMVKRTKVRTLMLTMLSDPQSQYSNLLVDTNTVSVLMGRLFMDRIFELNLAHTVSFTNYPVNSFLAKILVGYGHIKQSTDSSKFLDLTQIESWDAYHHSLYKSTRKERNRRRNKLQKLGNLDYQVLDSSHPRFQSLVMKCLEMKQRWLENTGKSADVFQDSKMQSFLADDHGELAIESDGVKALLHCLMLDEKPIAMELGYVYKNDYYSYLGAFELDWFDYSPGKVQIEFAQKWAKEQGLNKFDFLGDPSAYKANWTNGQEKLIHRFIPLSKRGYLYGRIWKTGIRPKLEEAYANSGKSVKQLIGQVYKAI